MQMSEKHGYGNSHWESIKLFNKAVIDGKDFLVNDSFVNFSNNFLKVDFLHKGFILCSCIYVSAYTQVSEQLEYS